jgi:hypothetical protein
MSKKLKILNLYAGIGGNRKYWDKKHDINLIFSKIIKMTPENLRNIIIEMEEIQAGRVRIETVQIAQDEPTN